MSEKFPEDETRRKPPENIHHLLKSMNDFFENRPMKGFLESLDELFMNSPFTGAFPVELQEKDTHYIINAKLPGIMKEQIEINVLQQYITITVNHRETTVSEDQKKGLYQKKDVAKRSLKTVPLTKAIDPNQVKATFNNGLLQIIIKKIQGKKVDIE